MKLKRFILPLILLLTFINHTNNVIFALEEKNSYIGDYIFIAHQDYATKGKDSIPVGGLPYNNQSTTSLKEKRKINNEEIEILPFDFPKKKINKRYTMASDNLDNPKIAYQVGECKTFKAYNTLNSTLYDKEIMVIAVGKHCVIWSELDGTSVVSKSDGEKVAKEYDDNIYPLISQYYGDHIDADEDGKLSIVYHDIIDNFDAKTSKGYIAGYFYQNDLSENQMDMINMDTNPGITNGIDNTMPTLIHELVHLINYSTYLLSSNPTYYPTWIDEGIAESAAQTYGHFIYDKSYVKRINHYNSDEQNLIANGEVSLTIWESKLENYDLSFLFFQYLRVLTQDYSWGGYHLFSSIYQQQLYGEDIFSNWLIPLLSNEDEHYVNYKFVDLLLDFKIALTLNNTTGRYGFKGEKGYNFKILSSSLQDFSLRPGCVVVKKYKNVTNYKTNLTTNIKILPIISFDGSYMYINTPMNIIKTGESITLEIIKIEKTTNLEKYNVSWSSSNFFKATVSKNGVVKAKRNGKVTIYATCNKVKTSIILNIEGGSGGCSSSGTSSGSTDLLVISSLLFVCLSLFRRRH